MGIIISDRKYRWPNGIVPYDFDDNDFPENGPSRSIIQDAIDQWNRNTLIPITSPQQ